MRVVFIMFPSVFSDASVYLMILAFITMIYGGLMSLAQDDFKRMLAYSSISQMGYLLLGVGSMTTLGISGAMLQYVTHAVGKAILFSVAGVLIVKFNGLRSISKMGGLAMKLPITAGLALLGFMQITGIPPSLGFWSEIMIVFGSVNRAPSSRVNQFHTSGYWLDCCHRAINWICVRHDETHILRSTTPEPA